MVREKVASEAEFEEIQYDAAHWEILREKRERAKIILAEIQSLSPHVFGSVARGDVTNHSDIDILITFQISEFQLLPILEKLDAPVEKREIVQATPLSAFKAVVTFSTELSLTFPLVPFYPREQDFFKFGGSIDLAGLEQDNRIPGINKKLMLVEPTPGGHTETRVTRENASHAARELDITVETI
ncbi:MAG TPA: nucleotidyltransferase domain-containing protein, partial [Candidatus Lokiarchaeia archaeon]|nr:nucleotidyltransferase domain-containing protein [Candidatus Lokiarchaeia archaeon]